jgi:hypothetical protein
MLCVIAIIVSIPGVAVAQACRAPAVLTDTVHGFKYCALPQYKTVVDSVLQKLRGEVTAAKASGRLVIYLSTPISPRGGGIEKINIQVAASVRARLEKSLGPGVWVLDPGASQFPRTGNTEAGGGDYMVMFTHLLAGADGMGNDFDMAYFTGPSDMRAFFGCTGEDVIGCLTRWLAARATTDPDIKKVADDPALRRAFLRYYAMRASVVFSSGCHDEWNIFVRINNKRRLGEQVAVWFDNRPASPAEMVVEVSPGYEVR